MQWRVMRAAIVSKRRDDVTESILVQHVFELEPSASLVVEPRILNKGSLVRQHRSRGLLALLQKVQVNLHNNMAQKRKQLPLHPLDSKQITYL
jgi:hypothetical protein